MPIFNEETLILAEARLENVIVRHGVPLELHSDQIRTFESGNSKHVMALVGIKKNRTTNLYHRSSCHIEALSINLR